MNQLPELERVRDAMPFAALVGVELTEVGRELVTGRLEWAPERCTAGGALHGGALIALADSCAGVCAYLNLPEGADGTATIESKSNLMRPVRMGSVVANARPLHRGRRFAVIETELRAEDGSLVAKTTQTQAFHYP